ncbi:MAG: EAL domain-containing protein [Myxococcota bacterium]
MTDDQDSVAAPGSAPEASGAAAPPRPAVASDDDALRIAGSWLQALTDGSKEAVALLDETGSVQYLSVSGAVQHMLGFESLDLMAMSPGDIVHPLDHPRVREAVASVLAHPGGRLSIAYRARHRAGHFVPLESTAVNRLRNPYVNAIVVHTREQRGPAPAGGATRGSRRPPRTDLLDEAGLLHHLEEAVERAATGSYRFAVLVVDLARHAAIVEAYGAEVAEAVTIEVGHQLHALLRPGDKLARLRRGPYAALLDGVGDRTLAERIAARVHKTVGRRFEVKGQDVLTGPVIGITTSDRRYERGSDVLRDALLATQQQSRPPGGPEPRPLVFRTQMQVHKTRQLTLLAELHQALSEEQLSVHYLPIVNMATRTLSGFEALARWEHPRRGLISPALFIPVAEEAGLIRQLGRWVLREATRAMSEWQKRYGLDPPLTLSVNVSPHQFGDYDFDEQVVEILDDTGFDVRCLVVELPETVLAEHGPAVRTSVERLRSLGVRLSLDNFGAGPTSFSSLTQLPYAAVKIHRDLVQRLGAGEERGDETSERRFVAALVSAAHELAMEVVAEGVERPGQATQLSKLWCEYAQGYLFGRPRDADGTASLLASYPRWWSD